MVCAAVLLPGFWARIAVLLALVFGYLLSWLVDLLFGKITLRSTPSSNGHEGEHDRVSWAGVKAADWIGFPSGTLQTTASRSCTRRASRSPSSCWCCPA